MLKLYLMWKDGNCAGKAAKGVLAELYPGRVKICRGTHIIRCIIDASSPVIDAFSKEDKEAEEKKRSRWTNALRYAVRNRATVKESVSAGCLEGTVELPGALPNKESHGISFPPRKGDDDEYWPLTRPICRYRGAQRPLSAMCGPRIGLHHVRRGHDGLFAADWPRAKHNFR